MNGKAVAVEATGAYEIEARSSRREYSYYRIIKYFMD